MLNMAGSPPYIMVERYGVVDHVRTRMHTLNLYASRNKLSGIDGKLEYH